MSHPYTWSLDIQLLLDKFNGKGLVEVELREKRISLLIAMILLCSNSDYL